MQAARSAAKADGVAQPNNDVAKASDSQEKANAKSDEEEKSGNDDAVPNGDEKDAEDAAAPASSQNGSALNQMLSAINRPPNQVTSTNLVGSVDDPSALSESPGEPDSAADRRRAPLRRGKWTAEEEAYASRLIQEFKAGLLPLTDGTTLRTFLSKLLNCDPMRISKKFVGSNCIGKQVFRRRGADVNNLTPAQIQQTRLELSELEKRFLDRVSQNKKSGGSPKSERPASKPQSGNDGGLSGVSGMSGIGNMNKSAAAAGRALLQGNKGGGNGDSGPTGLLAQLQASQPGMFDANTAMAYNSNASGGGQAVMGVNSASINNLMLQTGMTAEQISQLTQTKGINSSASLANLLGKKRSFDGLMSLDFQSMQSIDNLANLIQQGIPSQSLHKNQMKNFDWNSGAGAQGSDAGAPSSGTKGSLENLVLSLSGNNTQQIDNNNATASMSNQANVNYGNLLQSMQGNAQNGNINDLLQSMHQSANNNNNMNQNQNFGNLLQGMGNSFLQNPMMGNDFLNIMNGGGGDLSQQNMMHFNNTFAMQQNPMMAAAIAQQQLLAQAGGNPAIANVLAQQGIMGGMTNMANNFGNNFGNQNTNDLLQQLIAQQQGESGYNNQLQQQQHHNHHQQHQQQQQQQQQQGQAQEGNKRNFDKMKQGGGIDQGGDDGQAAKKQQCDV
ncbi:predicted protein [Thalassiosira pseudonana CCMP1335]|uniref:Myb-like domain-containing protein n=1 Tax=Thalassiosira pseudonana TaxID=35128 RepID=B8BSI5_THAPS|nr:predicted protein [Thalassiosira pseudonana CCMP1335]EED96728.1 predicted protein [Thalassiosira pseudonana CCMP1335]